MWSTQYRRRRSYIAPPPRRRRSSSADTLQQPEWDDTIHDLSKMRLSPQEQLKKKLERSSRNQLLLMPSAPAIRQSWDARRSRYGRERDAGDGNDYDCCSRSESEYEGPEEALRGAAAAEGSDADCSDGGSAARELHRKAAAWWRGAEKDAAGRGEGRQDQRQSQPGGRKPTSHSEQRGSRRPGSGCISASDGESSGDDDGGRGSSSSSYSDRATILALKGRVMELEADLRAARGRLGEVQGELGEALAQLEETQQQYTALEEEHERYVAHTEGAVARLQARVEQLALARQSVAASQAAPAAAAVAARASTHAVAAEPRSSIAAPPPLPAAAAQGSAAAVGMGLVPSWEEEPALVIPSYAAMRGSMSREVAAAVDTWPSRGGPAGSPGRGVRYTTAVHVGDVLSSAAAALAVGGTVRELGVPPAARSTLPQVHPGQAAGSMSFLLHARGC